MGRQLGPERRMDLPVPKSRQYRAALKNARIPRIAHENFAHFADFDDL
jgi:hypothetical protein